MAKRGPKKMQSRLPKGGWKNARVPPLALVGAIGSGGGSNGSDRWGIYQWQESVPSGGAALRLHWAFGDPEELGEDVGTELLDLTDPQRPHVINAGIYSVMAVLRLEDAQQAGKSALFSIPLGAGLATGILPLENDARDPRMTLAETCYVATDSDILITASHSAVAALDFSAFVVVQRIT